MNNRALRIIQRQGANQGLLYEYKNKVETLSQHAKHFYNVSVFEITDLDETISRIRTILGDLKDIHNLLSRPHTFSCQEKHEHVFPTCCDNECWCLEIRC